MKKAIFLFILTVIILLFLKPQFDKSTGLSVFEKSKTDDITGIPRNHIELDSALVHDKSMALDVVYFDDFEYEGDPSKSGWQFSDYGNRGWRTEVGNTAAFNDSTGGCWVSCNDGSDAISLFYYPDNDYGNSLNFDFWIRMVEGRTTVRIGLQDDEGRDLYLDYNHGWLGWEQGEAAIIDRWNLEGEDLENKWFHVVRNLTLDVKYALTRTGSPYMSFSPSKVIEIEIFQDRFRKNIGFIDNIRLSRGITFDYKNRFAPWTEDVFSSEEPPTLELTTPGFTIISLIIGIILLNYFLRKRSYDRIEKK